MKRFEEVYRQKHGVVPKGRARAPVKELYSRYRHLKQVVRDGSALHIQTVYRGFRVRRRYQLPSSKAREGAPTPSRVAGHRANARVAAASSGRRKRTESTDSSHAIDRDAFDRTAGATTHAAHSIPALKADKGELKKQLKQFDVDFKAKHGRMVRMRLQALEARQSRHTYLQLAWISRVMKTRSPFVTCIAGITNSRKQ